MSNIRPQLCRLSIWSALVLAITLGVDWRFSPHISGALARDLAALALWACVVSLIMWSLAGILVATSKEGR